PPASTPHYTLSLHDALPILRDLDKLGPLLERAFDLGINQVSEPQLDSSRRRELEREALAKAVEDARLNAQAVARAAGARLGAPRDRKSTRLNSSHVKISYAV